MNNTKYKIRVAGNETTHIIDCVKNEIFEDMGDYTKITIFIGYEFKEFEEFANCHVLLSACKRYSANQNSECISYRPAYIASYEIVPINSMFNGSKIVIEAYK